MIRMEFATYVADGGITIRIPAPARGKVTKFKATCNQNIAAAKTIDVQRAGTSVNLITVAAAGYTAGTSAPLEGTRDTTNKDLIFDPNSSTDTYKEIMIVVADIDNNAQFGFYIEFDDFAIVAQ